MGINGSSPYGYSAVTQPASCHVQHQSNPSHASRRDLALRSRGRGSGTPSAVTHSSRTRGGGCFAVDRFVDRPMDANGVIRAISGTASWYLCR